MKRLICLASAILAFFAVQTARAQSQVPQGSIVYSLPQTVVNVKICFEKTIFTPGPYASYAQKYLGGSPKTVAETSYAVKELSVLPSVEADPYFRYAVVLPEKGNYSINFLSFCNQGLIAIPDAFTGVGVQTSFTNVDASRIFEGKEPSGNIATITTTLYKSVRNDEGEYEKVPVQQSQTVVKSLEKKAEETAALIASLREKRISIITGDTDATFSGEALKASLDEIARLEKEYLNLFYGSYQKTEETRVYTILPKTGVKSYTICKMGNLSLSMELSQEVLGKPSTDGAKGRGGVVLYYRVPTASQCRILDGTKVLAESRILVYQFGEKTSINL